MTVRERFDGLLDKDASFFELGLWAAWRIYADWGEVPAAGLVTGIGRVHGHWVMVVAGDATVKAGAFFPQTVKKFLRAQRVAMAFRLPLVYLVDSSGVFLPLQDEIFPDEELLPPAANGQVDTLLHAPQRDPPELYPIVSADGRGEYNARDLLACVVDAGSLQGFRADYGRTLVTAFAQIDGRPVGIVASQRQRCKTAAGELQIGGVLYSDSAEKAARFVMECNQTSVPMVFFEDVQGFMVGREARPAAGPTHPPLRAGGRTGPDSAPGGNP